MENKERMKVAIFTKGAYLERGMGEDDLLVGFVRYTSDMDALLYTLDPEDEHLMKIVDLDKDDVLYREYQIKKAIIEYPIEETAAS